MMRSEKQRKTMGSNIRPGLLLDVVICFLLVLASLSIYWQTRHYPFINYDDNLYVTENFHIQNRESEMGNSCDPCIQLAPTDMAVTHGGY
jgi:hypothetical protein